MHTINSCCFFYPTTVVAVDDNEIFLNNLPYNLDKKVNYKLFSVFSEAINYIDEHKNNFPKAEDFLMQTEDFLTGTLLNVNIPKIYNYLYNPKRFETPAVIIVDHDMPGMTGIELCHALKNYPVKKIMLTGVADDKTAIQAFNEGIIHKFVHKNNPDVFKTIDLAIKDLQVSYFAEISKLLIKTIKNATFSFLRNNDYDELLSQILQKNQICEFYLTNSRGSMLLLTATGDMIWLVVQSDKEISMCHQIAKDNDAPDEILQPLLNKQKLLCLFSESDYEKPAKEWSSYLYKANNFKDIYYAIVDEKISFTATGIKNDKITTYRQFHPS
jgi:CheY-like chemotaxis protein